MNLLLAKQKKSDKAIIRPWKTEERSHVFVSSLHSRKRQLIIFPEENNELSYEIGSLYQALPSATCGSTAEQVLIWQFQELPHNTWGQNFHPVILNVSFLCSWAVICSWNEKWTIAGLVQRSTNVQKHLMEHRNQDVTEGPDWLSQTEKDCVNMYWYVYSSGGKSGTWWHLKAKLTSNLS